MPAMRAFPMLGDVCQDHRRERFRGWETYLVLSMYELRYLGRSVRGFDLVRGCFEGVDLHEPDLGEEQQIDLAEKLLLLVGAGDVARDGGDLGRVNVLGGVPVVVADLAIFRRGRHVGEFGREEEREEAKDVSRDDNWRKRRRRSLVIPDEVSSLLLLLCCCRREILIVPTGPSTAQRPILIWLRLRVGGPLSQDVQDLHAQSARALASWLDGR